MSKNVFVRAQNYVNKVLSIFSVIDKMNMLAKQYRSSGNTRVMNNELKYRYSQARSFETFMERKDISSTQKSKHYYWIDRLGNNSMPNIDRKLMKMYKYDEGLHFQLSTIYSNEELYDYYVQCLLFTAGFYGRVRKNVSHNSLNCMIRQLDEIYENVSRFKQVPY